MREEPLRVTSRLEALHQWSITPEIPYQGALKAVEIGDPSYYQLVAEPTFNWLP